MSGLVNGGGGMNDPILAAAEKQLESGMTSEVRESYLKIVNAGMSVALDKGPKGILGSLVNSKDPVADMARGAVELVLILRKEANGVMPIKAMVPAATTLMLKGLDFADKAGLAKVGNDELVRATHIFTDTLFARLGITKQMLMQATARVHGVTQDPAAMQKIKMKAGFVRHPDAAEPTPGAPNVPA